MSTVFRRSSNEARLEMTPLLDVIFLLLTFFIYSQLLLSRANVLPVNLPAVTTGAATEKAQIIGITLDHTGSLYLNEKPITMKELDATLSAVTDRAKQKVLVAIEDAPSNVDRVIQFIALTDLLRRSGFAEFSFAVKPPSPGSSPANPAGNPSGNSPPGN